MTDPQRDPIPIAQSVIEAILTERDALREKLADAYARNVELTRCVEGHAASIFGQENTRLREALEQVALMVMEARPTGAPSEVIFAIRRITAAALAHPQTATTETSDAENDQT